MVRRLAFLILLLHSAQARESLRVGHLWPGMTKAEVVAVLGQPAGRTPYSAHAYVVFSSQPLFAQEQSWYYEGPDGASHLLFRGERLRMVRAQTLQWQGRSFQAAEWPRIKAGVEAESRGLTVGLNRTPIVAGFFLSNLNAQEQQERLERFNLVGDKHHFDARGEIFRGKPGQVCRTCRQLGPKLKKS